MGCCDDPTEAQKFNRTDVTRVQEQYGNLLRDLFTSDPEKVILKQLNEASHYLRELAALNAHYPEVRKKAISLLEKDSVSILQRIIEKDAGSDIADCASQQLEQLKQSHGVLDKLFN